MKHALIFALTLIFLILSVNLTSAQKNRSRIDSKAKETKQDKETKESKEDEEVGSPAIVVDRRLAVLRIRPSLYAKPIQRMSVGRKVFVIGTQEADGVTFYNVKISPNTVGWIQSEAVIGKFRKDDDQRLFKLVQATEGFEQIDKTIIFLELFPESQLRPPLLLLMGDLMEEEAIRLSQKANRGLDRREMIASGAPEHSFYLNFPSLDRYGKLGVRFLFNINTKSYHYDGDSWFEIVRNFPKSDEAVEAQKRLEILTEKMEAKK